MSASLFLAASSIEVGGYINPWKCAALLVVMLVWVRLLTWVDKDTVDAHMPRVPLNLGFFGGLVAAVGLFFFLPGFIVAFPVLCLIFIIEVVVYLIVRNQKVGLADLKKRFKEWLLSFLPKSKQKLGRAGDVLFVGKGGAPLMLPEGDNVQPQIAGYQAMQDVFTEPLRKRGERVEVVAADDRTGVKYWVDGVSYEGAPVNKTDVSTGIGMLKAVMGLDSSDRRKPQTGTVKATIDGKKHEMKITTAGSTTGESMTAEIDWKTRHDLKVDQLGFTADQMKALQEMLVDPAGIVLLATPKGQGLTTLEYAILRSQDAFLTHIQMIERSSEIELEGITQVDLAVGATAGEAKQVSWVVSQEPDILLLARMEDPKSAPDLIKFGGNGHRAFVGLRAGSTFEALELWRKIVGDDKQAMKNLKMVIAGRVMRKLCDACKIDYTPDPDTLRKMNMPADRVSKLFTARTTPLKDSRGNTVVCEFCLDLRFNGRTGVYEIFTIDDEVRQTVIGGGSVNQLKMLFKKQKQRYLQEVALAKAVAGETSLHEVARILKSSGGETRGGSSSAGGARPTSGGGKPASGAGPKSVSKPPSTSSSTSSSKRSVPPAPRS